MEYVKKDEDDDSTPNDHSNLEQLQVKAEEEDTDIGYAPPLTIPTRSEEERSEDRIRQLGEL